jgi:hypothetical protein
VIAVSLSISIFLLWIPFEGKEMFSKNSFWNIWFFIYIVFTIRQMSFWIEAKLEKKKFLMYLYLCFCLSISFGIAAISFSLENGFPIGRISFLTLIIIDLGGRYLTKKYGEFV